MKTKEAACERSDVKGELYNKNYRVDRFHLNRKILSGRKQNPPNVTNSRRCFEYFHNFLAFKEHNGFMEFLNRVHDHYSPRTFAPRVCDENSTREEEKSIAGPCKFIGTSRIVD